MTEIHIPLFYMLQHHTVCRRINRTIYFCCPSSVFLQQNT